MYNAFDVKASTFFSWILAIVLSVVGFLTSIISLGVLRFFPNIETPVPTYRRMAVARKSSNVAHSRRSSVTDSVSSEAATLVEEEVQASLPVAVADEPTMSLPAFKRRASIPFTNIPILPRHTSQRMVLLKDKTLSTLTPSKPLDSYFPTPVEWKEMEVSVTTEVKVMSKGVKSFHKVSVKKTKKGLRKFGKKTKAVVSDVLT